MSEENSQPPDVEPVVGKFSRTPRTPAVEQCVASQQVTSSETPAPENAAPEPQSAEARPADED